MATEEELWRAADAYIAKLFVGEDEALEAALRDSNAAGLPQIAVAPAQGRALEVLARAAGAKRILEIGTLGGYSTICLARSLGDSGRLISLEASEKHAQVARKNIARAGLAEKVEIRVGRASETLPQLVHAGEQFDAIFIDANKDGYPEYLEAALRLSHPGTLIVADNVVRRSPPFVEAGEEKADDPNVVGITRFNEMLAELQRSGLVRASIVQTVGAKGHDGLAFAVVL